MAKRKAPRLTAEDEARFEETQRKLRERIAYREAKEREGEERRAAKARSPWGRLMRLLGRPI